jgi:hypothetical protein
VGKDEEAYDLWEDLALLDYIGSFPWERWLINRERRRQGKRPFRPTDRIPGS